MNFVELVEAVHDALGDARIAHAFGGALALGYIANPRGTVDIDVNVFVPPTEIATVVTALRPLGYSATSADATQIGGLRFTHRREPFPVDVFPSLDEHYDEVARRAITHPFGRRNRRLPFLSAEDLCVFKLSFGRPQDWVDLTSIRRAADIDDEYVERQLIALRGPTMYPRLARFLQLHHDP